MEQVPAAAWHSLLQVTSVLGDMVTDVVNVASPSGAVVGAAQFPLSAAYQTVGGRSLSTAVSVTCLPCTQRFMQVSCHVDVLHTNPSSFY